MKNTNIKDKIIMALFEMMQIKTYKDIKVTDIVRQANVSRESYYRNFNSKEDIIIQFLEKIKEEMLIEESNSSDILKEELLLNSLEKSFCIIKKYDKEFLLIYQELPNYFLQELFNEYIESFIGDIPNNSIERYKLYFMSGAGLNIVIKWIENGEKEQPIDMARTCVMFLKELI